MSNDNERLARELRARADHVGGHPLTLDDIKGSATSIRRRQRVATGAVAAAVLAVAVPFGFAVTDRGGDGAPDTPIATSPTTSTGPVLTDVSFDELALGADTEVPYVFDGKIHVAGVATPVGNAFGVTRYRDGFVVAFNDDDTGMRTLSFRDADGREYDTALAQTDPVASADRTVLTFVDADGTLVVTPGPQGDVVPLNTDGTVGGVLPVAVRGSERCADPAVDAGASCTVFFKDGAGSEGIGAGFTDTGGGPAGTFTDEFEFGLSGVSPDGDVIVGVTSVDELEPSSCSAALSLESGRLWETCDHTPTEFNQDGTLILGLPSYLDGFGNGAVAILDGATGEVLADFDLGGEGAITHAVWESSESLVAAAYFYEERAWALLRLNADGSYEQVPSVDLGKDDMTGPSLGR